MCGVDSHFILYASPWLNFFLGFESLTIFNHYVVKERTKPLFLCIIYLHYFASQRCVYQDVKMAEDAWTEISADVRPFSRATTVSGSLLGTSWRTNSLEEGPTESFKE